MTQDDLIHHLTATATATTLHSTAAGCSSLLNEQRTDKGQWKICVPIVMTMTRERGDSGTGHHGISQLGVLHPSMFELFCI